MTSWETSPRFTWIWCVSWGSWPISLPWISIPERWQIELTMFFCRFAVNSFWRNFFPVELLSWLRWFKRWHDRCQYHLYTSAKMTYSWTRIVIQKLSHIFDCVSLALAVLGTEILYIYIYIWFRMLRYTLETKTVEKTPRSYWIILDHIGLYWIILDHIGLYWIIDPSNSATLGRSLP